MATEAAWLNGNRLMQERKRKCALTSTGLLMEGLGLDKERRCRSPSEHLVMAVRIESRTRPITNLNNYCHGTHRASGKIVPEDLSALHHEFYSLCLVDIGQRIAGNGDDVSELALRNRPDTVLPPHFRRGIDGSSLQGRCWSHATNVDQRRKLESVAALPPGGTLGSTTEHGYDSLGSDTHPHILLENGDYPILAAGVLGVGVLDGGLDVFENGRTVVELFLGHCVAHFLSQTLSVLDGIAGMTGGDGVLQSRAAIGV